jgi:hypothetical protein
MGSAPGFVLDVAPLPALAACSGGSDAVSLESGTAGARGSEPLSLELQPAAASVSAIWIHPWLFIPALHAEVLSTLEQQPCHVLLVSHMAPLMAAAVIGRTCP